MIKSIYIVLVFLAFSVQARNLPQTDFESRVEGTSLHFANCEQENPALLVGDEELFLFVVVENPIRTSYTLGYVDGMNLYNAYFAEMFALDPKGTDVYLESTTAMYGLHLRICVDICVNGKLTGKKFCISFRQTVKDKQTGYTYVDTGKTVRVYETIKLNCCSCNNKVEGYLRKMAGKVMKYSAIIPFAGQNCRDFSYDVLNRLGKHLKKKRRCVKRKYDAYSDTYTCIEWVWE